MDFEQTPIDVMAKIALELSYSDILSLCKTSKRFDYAVCQKESFWMNLM